MTTIQLKLLKVYPNLRKSQQKQPKTSASAPISEHIIRIEEMAPETITEQVVNEEGEEVERVTSKRKLKKKVGPKEYLIEVIETFEENQPDAELVIQTTEITPEPESETARDSKIKIVKQRKPKKESLDSYIQKLIEEEIPKTELETYETTVIESASDMKKPNKVRKHHKKTTEIVDGVPQIVHEFTIQEFEPEDKEQVSDFVTQVEEEDTEKVKEDFEIKVDEEKEKPKPKPKKEKKSKVEVVEQEPVSIQDIEETVKVTEEISEDGTTKEVQVKKRKIVRKQGAKEQVFEITETTSNNEPLAEVTIVEVTEKDEPKEAVEVIKNRRH